VVAEHKKVGIQAATLCTEASCILATADILVGVDWSTVDGLTEAEVQCTDKGDGNGWSTEERGGQIYFRSSFTKAVAHLLRCRQASLSRRDRAASGHLQAQLGGRGHREVSGLRSNRRAKGARNVTHS